MAVRIDAVADLLRRTASLPSVTSFTLMGWSVVASDVGAGLPQPLVWTLDGGLTDGWALLWEGAGDGSMTVESYDGGVADAIAFSSRPATGTPFVWYIKCGASGTNRLIGGWRAADSNTWVTATTDMPATVAAAASMDLGGFLSTYHCDHRVWGVKCWDRELTADELQVESCYRRPVFPANLNFWWPLDLHTDVQDYGGNGRDATTGGTLTTEDSVGQLWRRRPTLANVTTGASHPTTGALSAAASAVAGTAAHLTLHATSGALSAQASTIAGSATHLTLHATSGALSAQAATMAGTAAHQHAATGALNAQAAAVAGTATHLTLHATSGALSAQAATIAGTAAHQHAASGALAAQASEISGAADHTAAGTTHATSGALAAADATISGSATHLTLHATSGALAAQASTIAGTAAHQHVATGAVAAQASTVAGTASHLTLHTSSGALASAASSIAGAAAHEHATSGALAAQAATFAGTAVHAAAGSHPTLGALVPDNAIIVGFASRSAGAPGPGFFNESSAMPGSTAKTTTKAGPRIKAPKVAKAAKAAPVAVVVHACTGALAAESATMEGGTSRFWMRNGLIRQKAAPSIRDRIGQLEARLDALRKP